MIHQIMTSNNEVISNQLDEILVSIHKNGPVNAGDFEKLALIKLFHPDVFALRETELLYLIGLFYKVQEPKNMLEEVYALFADTIEEETGKRFTPVQADAYKQIRDKKFFSFSAPTSAGKSFLFRELITNAIGDIIIVLPSRALIAEYLSAVKKLVDSSVLVLQFIDNINKAHTQRRVFIITPERGRELFKYQEEFHIELFLFDEAQLSEEEIRGIGFDAYVRRVAREFPNATKVFAHPFVSNPEAQLKKHQFVESASSAAYEQNAVGKVFVSVDGTKYHYFSPYNDEGSERVPVICDHVADILSRNGTILIYTSKSKLYSREYIIEYWNYLRFCPKLNNADAIDYVERLREYIGASKKRSGKSSLIISLMERGIVLHHGSMPLNMRLIIEQFVRRGYARICFATSTLVQGINMPFDAVYIDNYRSMDVLTLKNLIGRAGRSTNRSGCFEYGYTFVNKRNVVSFSKRMREAYELSEKSCLDSPTIAVEEDHADLLEAVTSNEFDDETRLTSSQMARIRNGDIDNKVKYILDSLLNGTKILTGREYYEGLSEGERKRIKDAFKSLYLVHLRRESLTIPEQTILSTAIPILLWHIQGKTFKEILALRYSFLTRQSEQRQIRARVKNGEISEDDGISLIKSMKVRFSQAPSPLPNKKAQLRCDFGKDVSVRDFDYDALVFDTYDYIDKVISLSLSDPLCAVFKVYYEKTHDVRALTMINYIRHGTNDPKEIWLLRYGFAFEEIEWIKPLVERIDEQGIVFSTEINNCEAENQEVIGRYIHR